MIVHKAAAANADGLEFILSDDTLDRYGDKIDAAGWDLRNFKNNPIALFGHSSGFPIGQWENLRVEGKRLIGRLKLAARGTSQRIDEIISLVEQGVLKAVSVGFRPIEQEPMATGGIHYRKQELLETSVVSVPANPAAVQLARSLNLSAETMALVFGENAEGTGPVVNRANDGEPAAKPTPISRKKAMNTPLSKRIEDAQADLVRDKDALTAHIAEDDADPVVTEELSGRIEQKEAALAGLKRAETALATKTAIVEVPGVTGADPARRPFTVAAKKVEPAEYVLRAATIKLLSHVHKEAPDIIRQRCYGDDEATKIVYDTIVRAASAPATTTTSGWASQLVQTVNADFMQTLLPASIYPGLSERGLRLTFGRNGAISIPSRSATPTIAGSFVAEGAAIPVRQGAFTSQTLTPKKMAVISTFTREIAQHSIPAIEGLIRDAIQEDTAVALDTVLLDATAASSIRPAGLRNGVSVTTATGGGGIAALVGDAKNLQAALITATNGNLRAPVWIMNPAQALAISLTANAGGDFIFADAMSRGTFAGYPVIQSPTVTAGMVILVDAADFVSVTGDEPLFDVSDQATLHMEDTTPLAISTTGTPNVVAAPVRSLWQTDTIGIRMILPMNWTLRRAGVLAWTQSVTW